MPELVTGGVERTPGSQPGSREQTSVEAVDPAVVRAVDHRRAGSSAGLDQLVAPVAAHVVERTQDAGAVPKEQDALGPDLHGALVAGFELCVPADAEPCAAQEVLQLPV